LKSARFFGHNTVIPDVSLETTGNKTVMSLYDPEMDLAGTLVRELILPESSGFSSPAVANPVFGRLIKTKIVDSFQVSEKDGSMELGDHKLYPMGSNQFRSRESVALFFQMPVPGKKNSASCEFAILKSGIPIGEVQARLFKKSWHRKAGLWEMVYILDFSKFSPGGYELRISLSGKDGFSTEKRLSIRLL
jgi:hypothetical protein